MIENKIKSVIQSIPDFPKVGIDYKDIMPIFEDANLCSEITTAFCDQLKKLNPEVIVYHLGEFRMSHGQMRSLVFL